MSSEEWRPIPGFDGYEVSDKGRVRSYLSPRKGKSLRSEPRIKKIWIDRSGRDCVTLATPLGARERSIDALLRLAFGEDRT